MRHFACHQRSAGTWRPWSLWTSIAALHGPEHGERQERIEAKRDYDDGRKLPQSLEENMYKVIIKHDIFENANDKRLVEAAATSTRYSTCRPSRRMRPRG